MNKNINYTIILGLLISTQTFANQSFYSPDQLAQFNQTNQCYSCDLSGARFDGNHSGAIFNDTNLTGSIGSGTFSNTNFSGSNLSSANWSSANLSYSLMSNILLIDADFSYANLSFVNFDGSNTNNAIFDGANLFGSNISAQQLQAAKSYCGATLTDGTKKNC